MLTRSIPVCAMLELLLGTAGFEWAGDPGINEVVHQRGCSDLASVHTIKVEQNLSLPVT